MVARLAGIDLAALLTDEADAPERRDDERSDIGYELDRSGIYGGFHCYARR